MNARYPFSLFLLAVGGLCFLLGIVGIGMMDALSGACLWIPLLGVGLLLMLVAVVMYRGSRPKKAPPAATAARQKHEVAVVGDETITYESVYTPGDQETASCLTLQVPGPSGGELRVRRQNWFDRVAQRVGLALKVKTGARDFDERFLIETDAIALAERFFADAENRQTIGELFDSGANVVSHQNDHVAAAWNGHNGNAEAISRLAWIAAPRLSRLACNLSAVASPAESGERRPAPLKQQLLILIVSQTVLTTVILLFVLFMGYRPVSNWPVIGHSLAWSLPVWIGWSLLVGWWVRGRSTSHQVWLTIVATSLFPLLLGGYAVMVYLNGALDRGEAVRHDEPILSKQIASEDTYSAVVKSWRDPSRTVKLSISSSEHDKIVPGLSRMEIVIKPGWLGFEWIQSQQVNLRPGR